MTRYYDSARKVFVTETEDGDTIGESELSANNFETKSQAKYLIGKYREDIQKAKAAIKKINDRFPLEEYPEMWF